LTANQYGLIVWNKWWSTPCFMVNCVRVTQIGVGKTESREWSDELKDEFTCTAKREWLTDINKPNAKRGIGGNKLRTYATFKTECKWEAYLNIVHDKAKRRLLAKYRMGVAPLRIEQGRYEANGLNDGSRGIQSSQRICQVCECGIEDEVHMLMKCSGYNVLRQKLMVKVRETFNLNALQGNDSDQFKKIMASDNNSIVNSVADFIWGAFKVRKQRLQEKRILV